jgi:hypothetical protein
MSFEDTLRINDRLNTLERRSAPLEGREAATVHALQQRAAPVFERHGLPVPQLQPGERATDFIARAVAPVREFSPFKDADLGKITDVATQAQIAGQILDAAARAAPRGSPDGSVRYASDRSSGREIIRPIATHEDAVWRQFCFSDVKVGRFRRPSAAELAVSTPETAPRIPR